MGKSRRIAKQPWWQAMLRERRKEELKKRVAQIEREREAALNSENAHAADKLSKDDKKARKNAPQPRSDTSSHRHAHKPTRASRLRKPEPRLIIAAPKSPQGLQIPVWVYDNMVEAVEGAPTDGQTIYVFSKSSKFLGSAIYNSRSKIRARLFSLEDRQFDDAFVEERIIAAWKRRRYHFDISDSFRAVFSESDGLPGLIADKIGSVLVVQSLTKAVEDRRHAVIATLRALYDPKAIVVRDDIPVREKEGLVVAGPVVIGELQTPLAVNLDGLTYFCDPIRGQKTGLFLDQRFNRRLVLPWVAEKRVLDLYSHVGGWGFVAAQGGAREVITVDSSEPAIELARLGAEANRLKNIHFECADVFDFLTAALQNGDEYDVVVCDPPAFAKSHKHLEEAEHTYLSLFYRAMKLVAPEGILVVSSCSQALSDTNFALILATAARNARRRFVRLARGSQPPDHPVLLGFPESEYLKCWVLQRME